MLNYNILHVIRDLSEGLLYTCLLFFVTLLASLPLGLIISFGSMSKNKLISRVTRAFVWVIRGTPLMLQILIFDTGPGLVFALLEKEFGISIPSFLYVREMWKHFMMVSLAFSVNYACYFSEIYRGGIQSVPHGQYEAASVLGMTRKQTFFKVILLQVVKRIVAPMSNEIITLVKDTALASVVIHIDLMTVAKNLANVNAAIEIMFYAGIYYLIFNGILTILLGKLEKKLDYFKV